MKLNFKKGNKIMNSSKTKKTFITFLLLLVGATNIYAADYYIAQNAAGNNDATSCTAAKAYSWNWKTPMLWLAILFISAGHLHQH